MSFLEPVGITYRKYNLVYIVHSPASCDPRKNVSERKRQRREEETFPLPAGAYVRLRSYVGHSWLIYIVHNMHTICLYIAPDVLQTAHVQTTTMIVMVNTTTTSSPALEDAAMMMVM